jgi:Zn-dependent protease with chaperone function
MDGLRNGLCTILAGILTLQPLVAARGELAEAIPASAQQSRSLSEFVEAAAPIALLGVAHVRSVEIAALAERSAFDQQTVSLRTETVKRESKAREESYKTGLKLSEKQVEANERELEKLRTTRDDPATNKRRKALQCEIARLRKDVTDKTFTLIQDQIAADVEMAKLQLLANWPAVYQKLDREIATGTISSRPFGNVLDIGSRSTRSPFEGQAKDIAWGRREVEEARRRNTFPKEITDPVVTEYVNRLAHNLARNSDLEVSLKVFVVQQEVRKDGKLVLGKDGQPEQVANAMALPGGYLVIFAGLMQSSANEAEFAGAIAHEMAHCAARHAHRMSSRATKFSVIQLAATIGLQVFAPGLFSAASYVAYQLKGLLLQAIFSGLGLVFTMDALGVSRDFELEADQLGMQYAWKTGYDPRGFMDLFDQMSEKEGHASRTSFFATHPAFGDRILNSLKEYKALSSLEPDRSFIVDTSEFQEVKLRLQNLLRKTDKQLEKDLERPSLRGVEPKIEECTEFLPISPGLPPAVVQDRVRPGSLTGNTCGA